jgi:hypothetical protein
MKKYNANSGWFGESHRHSLASLGVRTKRTKPDYMYDLETIKSMNRERVKASVGKSPLTYSGITDDLRHIPNFGDYRPKGWKLVNTYFVDSSGMGGEDELAMTFAQFARKAREGKGYAIIEEGQFQVHIGEFEKKSDYAKKEIKVGDIFHVDTDFEGKRLVDDVKVGYKPSNKYDKKILVYSPHLRANILVRKSDMRRV